jgi:hypothetical protein
MAWPPNVINDDANAAQGKAKLKVRNIRSFLPIARRIVDRGVVLKGSPRFVDQ